MRLIDADALEELFREVIGGIAKRPEINGNLEHMIRASAMVVEMIKDAPTIEPQPHWIPCSERLPEEETDVFVCNANGDIEISRGSLYSTEVKDYFIWHTTRWRFGEPIAWMSLPKSYREEGDSN